MSFRDDEQVRHPSYQNWVDTLSCVSPRDRRRLLRKSAHLTGEISLGDGSTRRTCKVVDISAAGARLKVADNKAQVADSLAAGNNHLSLLIDRENVYVECKVVWQKASQLGVAFYSPFQHR